MHSLYPSNRRPICAHSAVAVGGLTPEKAPAGLTVRQPATSGHVTTSALGYKNMLWLLYMVAILVPCASFSSSQHRHDRHSARRAGLVWCVVIITRIIWWTLGDPGWWGSSTARHAPGPVTSHPPHRSDITTTPSPSSPARPAWPDGGSSWCSGITTEVMVTYFWCPRGGDRSQWICNNMFIPFL